MTTTKPKTVKNGHVNGAYLASCLKANLLYARPFRFIYTKGGWKVFTRYDKVTSDLPQVLIDCLSNSLIQAGTTGRKQIQIQCKDSKDMITKMQHELARWILKTQKNIQDGNFKSLMWNQKDLMKTDVYTCHEYPLKDFSKEPAIAKDKLISLDKPQDTVLPSPASLFPKKPVEPTVKEKTNA